MRILTAIAAAWWMLNPLVRAAAEEWQPATPGYPFEFPRDHGQHPEHKIEWWYWTGNVETSAGRRFGYQLTFFRIGVVQKPSVNSSWALRDVWMAHFAISDLQSHRYLNADRLNRAGPGLAGATEQRVWNEDWSMAMERPGTMRLRAGDGEAAIDLELNEGKPPVIHGEAGISQKGAAAGNASHYYSLTRMPTKGRLRIGRETFEVSGESWMDHEFGTTFLEKNTQGWDWLSAQLDDGSELMLFRLRRSPGSADVSSNGPGFNAGTLVKPDGTVVALAADDFSLTPGGVVWKSSSGASYPVEWQVAVPEHEIQLTCVAAMPNQEFRADATPNLSYWEGAVDYQGKIRGRQVAGRGYLEMTGYSGRAMSVWFGGGGSPKEK